MEEDGQTVVVCGGGNGAHALIPVLGAGGKRVRVYAPYGDEAERLQRCCLEGGGIRASGRNNRELRCCPEEISRHPSRVISEADLIIMVAPAFSHEAMLEDMAPHLKEDAWVGAMPARGGLEYAASRILARHGKRGVLIFGLQTLPWACRLVTFGREVKILGQKRRVYVGCTPAGRQEGVARALSVNLGMEVCPADNMLAITLGNAGQIIHPGIFYSLVRKRGRFFEEGGVPLFYQSVDEETVELLESMSAEVRCLAGVLEERFFPRLRLNSIVSVREWLLDAYADQIADSTSLASAFRTNRAYEGLRMPVREVPQTNGEAGVFEVDFHHRYLAEDIPFGLLVVKAIASLAGVPTPVINEVIEVTSAWRGVEYLAGGRLEGRDLAGTRIPQNYGINHLETLVEVTLKGQKAW